MKEILKIWCWIFLAIVLCGCYTDKAIVQDRQNFARIVRQLSGCNVRVLKRDKSVVLVLPFRNFFVDNSANFIPKGYQTFDLIYSFANFYRGSTIAVTGCSKREYSSHDKLLVLERSRRIVQQLCKYKISANFIYADIENNAFCNKKFLRNSMLIEFSSN